MPPVNWNCSVTFATFLFNIEYCFSSDKDMLSKKYFGSAPYLFLYLCNYKTAFISLTLKVGQINVSIKVDYERCSTR